VRRGALLALLAFGAFVAFSFLADPVASAKASKKSRKGKAKSAAVANFDTKLPVLGTRLSEFPAGPGKALADQACLNCHSADMVWQQHLTEKQWTANVTKMIGWGAEIPDAQKDALVAYLVANFGPENTKFAPVVSRPVGR